MTVDQEDLNRNFGSIEIKVDFFDLDRGHSRAQWCVQIIEILYVHEANFITLICQFVCYFERYNHKIMSFLYRQEIKSLQEGMQNAFVIGVVINSTNMKTIDASRTRCTYSLLFLPPYLQEYV